MIPPHCHTALLSHGRFVASSKPREKPDALLKNSDELMNTFKHRWWWWRWQRRIISSSSSRGKTSHRRDASVSSTADTRRHVAQTSCWHSEGFSTMPRSCFSNTTITSTVYTSGPDSGEISVRLSGKNQRRWCKIHLDAKNIRNNQTKFRVFTHQKVFSSQILIISFLFVSQSACSVSDHVGAPPAGM